MEDDAKQRKARLKALREKAGGANANDEPAAKRQRADDEAAEDSKPVLKFRNYKATTEDLKEKELPRPQVPDIAEKVEDQVTAGKESASTQVDLMNLAPRKPDWDLKRDCTARLEKLQRRTQRAIASVVQERMAADGDLAEAVDAYGNDSSAQDTMDTEA
ncbi:coiled-coil domain-containing protein 12-like [Sycon ciliatum]|uniref:coiled-coil domain-containing protein 12-like n=1 Tax=Sycon ciliatum TaxID=27933 RepID=UPI0020AE06A6|eukprot:scpid103540/ scgid8698/ Coiled-coil domain-containing protein 12